MAILNNELLSNHHLLTTDDLEESRKITNELWEDHDTYIAEGSDFNVHMNRVSLNSVTFTYIQCPSDLILTSTKKVETRYSFHLLLDGDIDYQVASTELTADSNTGVIHLSSEKMQMKTDSIRALFIDFDKATVDEALNKRFGNQKMLIPAATNLDYQTGQGILLRSLSLWCVQQLNHQEKRNPDSKVWHHLEQAILNAFIDCIDRRETERSSILEDQRAWFNAIEAWIDEHLSETIMLQDLAKVAGVSERTLQKAFRTYHNCTPMSAVYMRRLNRARTLLQTPQPETTVLQIALDVGYTHPSRFASHYQKQFGEKPSLTLNIARTGENNN
jgi:AraC-like DNA-binding protein